MKKNRKIIFAIIPIILIIIISIIIISSDESNAQDTYHYLDNNSEQVKELSKLLNNTEELRKASYDSQNVSNETLIKQIISSINVVDYQTRTVPHQKIICQVTNSIFFTSSTDCVIRVIGNDKMMKYQKKLFNTSKELKYIELTYHGLHCKNNGKAYYCHIIPYTENSKSYTLIDHVYEDKETIHLFEYYLKVNVDNLEDCRQYFSESYCQNYANETAPIVVDDKIKKDGVYYEHIFQKNENGEYYLKSSNIIIN